MYDSVGRFISLNFASFECRKYHERIVGYLVYKSIKFDIGNQPVCVHRGWPRILSGGMVGEERSVGEGGGGWRGWMGIAGREGGWEG